MTFVIGVDIDDTLAETVDAIGKSIWHINGKPFNRELMQTYLLSDIVEYGIGIPEAIQIFDTVIRNIRFIEPALGSQEKIATRKANGYQIIAVTGRSNEQLQATEQWLQMYYSDAIDKVYCVNSLTHKASLKSEIMKQIGAKVMIEDHSWYSADICTVIPVYLLNKPWNRDFDTSECPRITRVHSRDEIPDTFDQ